MKRSRLTKREQRAALLRKRHRERLAEAERRAAESFPIVVRAVWMSRHQLRALYP